MMQTISKPRESVPVWDPLIRIFHWSLAGFFLLAYVTEDELMSVHVFTGYAVAGLIVFRLIWGLIGTQHARFTDFVTSPTRLTYYLGQLVTGRAPRYLGHNPAGAAMIIVLLASLALTAFTGTALIAGDGIGPLAGTIFANLSGEAFEEVHEFFANLTLLLVVLHVTGMLISSLLHRENLVKAMLTGRKQLAQEPASDIGRSVPGGTVGGEAS